MAFTPFGPRAAFQPIELDPGQVSAAREQADLAVFNPSFGGNVARNGRRVLLVEDVEVNRVVVGAMLRNAGFRVDAVDTGKAALQAVDKTPYDAVLCDLHLPDMHGTDIIRGIHAHTDERADMSILALSADVVSDDRTMCEEAGANDLLSKPFDQATLGATVESLIGKDAGDIADAPTPAAPVPVAPEMADDEVEDVPLIVENVMGQFEADVGTDAVSNLVEKFLDDARSRLGRVSAEADMPRHDVEREIHSVGSSAATFGAQRLERRARELEHDCRAGRSFEEIDFHRRLVVLNGVLAETEQAFRSSYGATDGQSGSDTQLSRQAGE